MKLKFYQQVSKLQQPIASKNKYHNHYDNMQQESLKATKLLNLPVKFFHSTVTNQGSINSWKIIPCDNDRDSACNIRFPPVLTDTNSCWIITQIHQRPNNNLIVDRHLSIS